MMVPQNEQVHDSQVAVVYVNAVLKGVTMDLAGDVLANLVALIPPDHPGSTDLLKLRPTSVIVGPYVGARPEDLGENAIFSAEHGEGALSLLIRLADAIVVVRCRRVLIEAITESWVESVVCTGEGGDPISKDAA